MLTPLIIAITRDVKIHIRLINCMHSFKWLKFASRNQSIRREIGDVKKFDYSAVISRIIHVIEINRQSATRTEFRVSAKLISLRGNKW